MTEWLAGLVGEAWYQMWATPSDRAKDAVRDGNRLVKKMTRRAERATVDASKAKVKYRAAIARGDATAAAIAKQQYRAASDHAKSVATFVGSLHGHIKALITAELTADTAALIQATHDVLSDVAYVAASEETEAAYDAIRDTTAALQQLTNVVDMTPIAGPDAEDDELQMLRESVPEIPDALDEVLER